MVQKATTTPSRGSKHIQTKKKKVSGKPPSKKFNNIPVGDYRSKLEAYAAWELKKNNIWFEYEPFSLELWPAREFPESYEKVGKLMRYKRKERSISYTPDFVGRNWIMETKGMKTRDFSLRWKLFKEFLQDNNLNYYLFVPSTKSDVRLCIKKLLTEIKPKWVNRRKNKLYIGTNNIKDYATS